MSTERLQSEYVEERESSGVLGLTGCKVSHADRRVRLSSVLQELSQSHTQVEEKARVFEWRGPFQQH